MSSYIANDESLLEGDSGQQVVLQDFVSGGAAPYSYTWYNGAVCGGAPIGSGNPLTVTLGAPGVVFYSVSVTDSALNPATTCEAVVVNVNPTLEGTFTMNGTAPSCPTMISGICEINSQVEKGANYYTDVTFSGGTGPWRAVTIYSGTDSVCGGDTTKVASLNDINGSEAIFAVPVPSTPSSITFFCAVLSDSAGNSITLGPIQVNTSPALALSGFGGALAITSVDVGAGGVVPQFTDEFIAQWVGGTAPYILVVYSGSSSNCAADDQLVGASAPTTGSTAFITFTSPTSTTYYCGYVFDSSVPGSLVGTPAQLFTVEPLLAVQNPSLSTTSTEVENPMYEGIPVTATVTWSGGTGPFDVFLFQTGPACVGGAGLVPTGPNSNPQTGVSKSPVTFTFLSPNAVGTCSYYAEVVDVTGTAVFSPGTTTLTVASYLGITLITISAVGIDQGQTETITVSANWAGGSEPYTATLYSGPTASSCSTKVASQSGITGTSATFSFTSPNVAQIYYCIGVTDSSTPASSAISTTVLFTTSPPPKVTLPPSTTIEAGTSTILTPVVASSGIGPDFFQWFIGSGCQAGNAITGALPAPGLYNTGIITTTTTYSVLMTDSSTGTPALSSCATETVNVNDGPLGIVAINSPSPNGGGLSLQGDVFAVCTSPGQTHAICRLDSDSLSEVAVIPLIGVSGQPLTPYGLAVDQTSPNWYGTIWVTGVDTGTNDGNLCQVDAYFNSEVNCVVTGPAGSFPTGVAENQALGQVYVADNGNDQVTVVTEGAYPTITVTGTVNVGPGPMGVAVGSNNNIYVTDNGGNTLSVLQPHNPFPFTFGVTTVTVGFEPVGVAVNPANGNVLVANSGSGTVSVIDGNTLNVIQTVKIGDSPQGIDIDTVAGVAYVADGTSGAVTPINLATFAVGTPITVGTGPFGVAFVNNPAYPTLPNYVFVTNSGSNTVSAINTATQKVVATIVVP